MRRTREGFRGLNKRLHRLFEVSRVLPLACAPGQQKPQSKNPFEARPFYRTCRQSRNQLNGLAPLNNPCAEAKKRHHAHWNYCRTTPRYAGPPAGALRHRAPQVAAFAAHSASSRPHGTAPVRTEPGSGVSSKRLCRLFEISRVCLSLALPDSQTRQARALLGFIRFDVHAVKAGISVPLNNPRKSVRLGKPRHLPP